MVNRCSQHLVHGTGSIVFPDSEFFFSSDTKIFGTCAVIQLVILSCTKLDKYTKFLTKLSLSCVY
jgi:hypothetical protein